MAERVTEIEQLAHAGLGLVLRHDRGLRGAGAGHRMAHGVRLQREHLVALLCEPVKEGRIIDKSVLQDLSIPRLQFALRKRRQQSRIGDHEARLVEGAHEVFSTRGVHGGLSAYGGINLRQQRRRHLHETHAAFHETGREPTHITDDAAAEGDQHVAPVGAARQQPVEHIAQLREGLGLFAGRQGHPVELDARAADSRLQFRRMMLLHRLVRQHIGARTLQHHAEARPEFTQRPMPGQDVIGACAKCNTDRFK